MISEEIIMKIRYDELKLNDVINFHGANLKIVKLTEQPAPANEWYSSEKTITFDVEPADEEAEKIIGKFYSHGTYGGVGCLTTFLVRRN